MNLEFNAIFGVPECVYPYIDLMVKEAEQFMIITMGDSSISTKEYADKTHTTLEAAENQLISTYKKSIVNIDMEAADHWKIGNFYERLGVFCQYESEVWLMIPRLERDKINRWYMDTFISINKPRWESGERKDTVTPLKDAIKYIENHNGPISVRSCDCRNIFDNCRHTRETCISFDTGPNSSLHRGQSRLLTKEEAVDLVKACEKDGLMHTLEGVFGMCNCCGDCCFLYQAAKECNIIGTWPITYTLADFHPDKCISCGLCVKRCNLDAFTKVNERIQFDAAKCVGCGICATTCPKAAIEIVNR